MSRIAGHLRLYGRAGDVRFPARVVPRAKRMEVRGVRDGELWIAVTAQPRCGAANTALVKVLAQLLGVNKSRVEIVHGLKSRRKVIRVGESGRSHRKTGSFGKI